MSADVRALSGQQPTGRRVNMIVPAIVSTEQPAPTAFTDPLFVVFDTYASTSGVTFIRWPRSHGDAIFPTAGDPVVVAYDIKGVPHVMGWGI